MEPALYQPLLSGGPAASAPLPTTTTPTTPSSPPRHTLSSPPSPSPAPFPPSSFQVGDLVTPRYRITGLLGRGTTCITYAAEHTVSVWPRPGRALALKAFPLTALTSCKTLDLFQQEAATLRTLAHPAIPTYIDSFEVNDPRGDRVFVLVQHRATGASLQYLIDHGFPFSTPNTYAVFRQLLEVLVHLGDLNPPLLHRDIKPANVILDVARGRHLLLSLVDFRAVNTRITATGGGEEEGKNQGDPAPFAAVSTSGFTPPEQLGGAVDARSDLYAAAATVFYMLTGRPLCTLPQTRLKIDMDNVIPASERVKLGSVYTVMCKLLEPAPEDRYECAAEALDALLSNENTQQVREGAEGGGGGDGSGGGETGGLSRTEMTALSGAEAIIAYREVERLQMLARKSEGGDGGGGVGKQFELLADRAGGGRVPRRRKPAESEVWLQCDRSDRLLKVKRSAKPCSGAGIVCLACSVFLTVVVTCIDVAALTDGTPLVFWPIFLPLYGPGLLFAWSAADVMTRRKTLVVSFGGGERERYYFELSKQSAVKRKRVVVEGDARDLKAASVERRMHGWEDDLRRLTRRVQELVLIEENEKHEFWRDLQLVEKEWLRDEINDFLNAHRHWR